MYLIDKPLYAIELPDGSLAEDQWANWRDDFPVWITFSKNHAEREAKNHENAKVVLYSQWWEEKVQREAAQREQMNPTSNGDDFPVVEPAESQYKFILVNDQTGETVCDLDTEFESDVVAGSCPSDAANYEALQRLGYSVKVVKKST